MYSGGQFSIGPQPSVDLGCNISPFHTAEQIKAEPVRSYLVRSLLPAQGVAAIYGEPGSGKSFLAMDLVFAIATGVDTWFGLRVRRARVLYIALEGRGGLGRRIRAWEQHYNRELSHRAQFHSDLVIHDEMSVEELGRSAVGFLGTGCVIVVDTLNQAAPGADENSSADMGSIIAGAQRLAAQTAGLVILVHHSGKDRAKGLRGHSSLLAAMDAVIEVSREGDFRAWRAAKLKDDDCGSARQFRLKSYVVGQDEDGDDVRSCAIEVDLRQPAVQQRALTGRNRLACMEALKTEVGKTCANLTWERAVEVTVPTINSTPGRRRTRAKETLESMIHSGHLRLESGTICIVT